MFSYTSSMASQKQIKEIQKYSGYIFSGGWHINLHGIFCRSYYPFVFDGNRTFDKCFTDNICAWILDYNNKIVMFY